MRERRQKEIQLVKAAHPKLEVGPNLDWFILTRLVLTPGWSLDATDTLILIPPGYPTTPPDNFYTSPDLRLKNGAMPGNATPASQLGRQWLQFSYHVEDWQPHADSRQGHNLLTFLEGIRRRLSEVN